MEKFQFLEELFESYKLFLSTQPKKNRARDLILDYYEKLIADEIKELAEENEPAADDESEVDDEDDH